MKKVATPNSSKKRKHQQQHSSAKKVLESTPREDEVSEPTSANTTAKYGDKIITTTTNNNNTIEHVEEKKVKREHQPTTHRNSSFIVDELNVTKNIHISAIKRLCFNPTQSLLAVARFNSEIEIWSIDGQKSSVDTNRPIENCTLIKRLPGKIGTTIESIIWTGDNRLFTAGLHGMITEWDLERQSPKRISTSVLGGAIWSMDHCAEKNLIAIACEDGAVRLINDEDLSLKFFLAPSRTNEPPSGKKYKHCENSHRMLTTKIIDGGNKVLVGGMTGVYCFDLNKRTLVYKISLKNSFCWCMEILNDSIMVVGDSEGNIHFCDYRLGAIVNSVKGHDGDVLRICIQKPGVIYSTGVDGSISMYKEVGKKYVSVIKKRPSLHDLLDMVYCEKEKSLYFGGLNCAILRMKTEIFYRQQDLKDKIFDRIRIKPNRDLLKVATGSRLALYDNLANQITLLKLPESNIENRQVSLNDPASILMQVKIKSKGNWYSSMSDISPNGKHISVASVDCTYLITLATDENGGVSLENKINLSDKEYNVVPGHYTAFAGNNHLLIASRDCSTLQLFNIEKKTVQSIHLPSSKIDSSLENENSPFRVFSNSINGLIANEKYVIVSKGNLVLCYRLESLISENNKVHFEIELPTHNGFIYKIGFLNPCDSVCPAFYSLSNPNTITVFDANKRRTIISPLSFPTEKLNQAVISSLHQLSLKYYLVTSLTRCFLLDSSTLEIKDYVLANRLGKTEDMIGFSSVCGNELIMASFDYNTHTEELLPPVIDRKRFGT
ncbi:predicted protein [Naegleria gruberi]|uniref:Predicted protein n=1 Tax=Naegleria gruberi TaxID=5762 RepID=D2UY30_NAEGR|nr:uncharacterized protein NAEGRDRAFT_61327 [Naegleria gruberi]EFC50724.1 predicted protein [Naegleria gruberi]|eukprot:XP_002683468.1 predicted protein [Naegleria gruberi strain NEG-M]